MRDARIDLWTNIKRVLQTRESVLIRTFAIGRTQTMLVSRIDVAAVVVRRQSA
jgi:predicted metal-dependent RNase